MSLINDALKRARESDKSRPSGPPPMRPLQPVYGASGGQFGWLLPVIVAIVLVLSGWIFWKWHQASHHVLMAKPAPALTAKAPPAPSPAPAHASAPAPASRPAQGAAAPPPVVPRPAPVAAKAAKPLPEPAPAAPEVEAPWPTPLTLQAIIFSTTHPLALINGKSVGPGDTVAGVTVAKINRTSVMLQWDGHSRELFSNEH
jgi:hypothetical protein